MEDIHREGGLGGERGCLPCCTCRTSPAATVQSLKEPGVTLATRRCRTCGPLPLPPAGSQFPSKFHVSGCIGRGSFLADEGSPCPRMSVASLVVLFPFPLCLPLPSRIRVSHRPPSTASPSFFGESIFSDLSSPRLNVARRKMLDPFGLTSAGWPDAATADLLLFVLPVTHTPRCF